MKLDSADAASTSRSASSVDEDRGDAHENGQERRDEAAQHRERQQVHQGEGDRQRDGKPVPRPPGHGLADQRSSAQAHPRQERELRPEPLRGRPRVRARSEEAEDVRGPPVLGDERRGGPLVVREDPADVGVGANDSRDALDRPLGARRPSRARQLGIARFIQRRRADPSIDRARHGDHVGAGIDAARCPGKRALSTSALRRRVGEVIAGRQAPGESHAEDDAGHGQDEGDAQDPHSSAGGEIGDGRQAGTLGAPRRRRLDLDLDQLQGGQADAYDIAHVQDLGRVHLHTVDERPVRRSEILDREPALGVAGDARVTARQLGVVGQPARSRH